MLDSETTPSTQVRDTLSLEHVFNILLTRLTGKRLGITTDTLPFVLFDLNISYQSTEGNEKTGTHSSVLVGYTREELFEKAIKAAAYYADFSIFKQFGGISNQQHPEFGSDSFLHTYLTSIKKGMLEDIGKTGNKLQEQINTYLSIVEKHAGDYFAMSEMNFTKDVFQDLESRLESIKIRIQSYFEYQIIFLDKRPVLLENIIEYLDAPVANASSYYWTNSLDWKVIFAWNNVLDKVSDKLESLFISSNEQRYGKSSAAKFHLSDVSRKHVSKSLINCFLSGKSADEIRSNFYSKHIDAIRSSEQKFDEAMLELENRLGSSYMDEKGKEREFERIKALFCLPNGDNAENWFKIFNSIYSNIIRYGYEYINRWGSGRVNDENSPYDIFIKLVKDLFEFLDKSSYMVSGINGSKVNLSERPKVTLEFKVKDPDGSSGREEVSFDFILSHPHIAGKEVRINDCSVPNGIKQCILDSSSSLLNSSTYNKIMREEFESNAVRGSYLDMIRSIFQDRNFLPSILAKACSGIANKDGLAILEDYEKFIPLYLYVELIREASSTRFRDAFDYSRPEISKPVIVLTEKDKQTVL